jgi:hypothetical protein
MSRRMISQKDQDYVKVLSTAIDADKEGNAVVDGNLKVNGTIEQDTYELDEDLGLTLTSEAQAAGFSIFYQHERISNGKLNIVIGITKSKGTGSFSGLLVDHVMGLPSSVYSKIYASLNKLVAIQGSYTQKFDDNGFLTANNPSTTNYALAGFNKLASGDISLYCYAVTDEDTYNSVWRFEFNFIL